MTTLNTIIEEEKINNSMRRFEPFLKENVERSIREYARRELKKLLTTAMQRAYEAGREADPLKGERRRIIEQICQEERAKWLRSEIEKLGVEIRPTLSRGEEMSDDEVWNQALTSIITRYKEELKVLESK